MKSSAEPNHAIALHNSLMEQIDIAQNTVDSVLSGKSRFDAFYSASLQLKTIKATAEALKQAVPLSAISAPSYISQDIHAKLYEAADFQIMSIGIALGRVLSRLDGNTLGAVLAGKPNTKTLLNLLGDIYGEIGVMHRLITLTQFAHTHMGVNSDRLSRLVEALCLDSIKAIKGGAE